MNALTLSATRRRDKVVILEHIGLAPKSPAILSRLIARAKAAISARGLCMAAIAALAAVAYVAWLLDLQTTFCASAMLATGGIFFAVPALGAKAQEGGAR